MSDIIDKIREMKKDYSERQVARVTFNPVDKVEEKPKEDEKPQGILGKLKANTKDAVNVAVDKEKEQIKEDYLTLCKNQMKASNLILTDTMMQIEKVFREMLKEDDSYNLDDYLLKSEKQERAIMRNQKREYLQLSKLQLEKALTADMTNFFSRKFQEIRDLKSDNIEIIRKVKLTTEKLTLTTDEGDYELDARKASYFGGYIYLRRNMLTETVDLEKIAKDLLMKNNKTKAVAQTKAWITISPIYVPVGDDKVLMMPLDYLKDALSEFLTTIDKRMAAKKKAMSQHGLKDEEEFVASFGMDKTPREIVESLLALEEPESRAVILFPYNKLQDNGVDFECDLEQKGELFISTIEKMNQESADFITWNSVKQLKETSEIEKKFLDIIKMLDKSTRPDLVDSGDIEKYDLDLPKDDDDEEKVEEVESAEADESEESEEANVERLVQELTGNAPIAKKSSPKKDSKKNLTKMKKHYEALLEIQYEKISELISDIKSTEITSRDWSIPVEAVKHTLTEIKFTLDDELYNKCLVEVIQKDSGINEVIATDVATRMLEDLARNREVALVELDTFLEVYNQQRKKVSAMQSAISSAMKYPYLDNLDLNVKAEYATLKLAPLLTEGLLETYSDLKQEVESLQKYPIPIIKPNLTKREYDKIRLVVKQFGDRPYVNWLEILKIVALRETSLLKSNIRFFPDIQALKDIPELKEDMIRLNGLRKFVVASELNEEEDLFNKMFNEIATKRKGLLCAIDYKGLIWYIVNTEEPLKGEELVQYIPAMTIVNKYFSITESIRTYDKIEVDRLIAEVSNIPATYLAMTHVLKTIENSLSFEDTIFGDSYKDLEVYEELKNSLRKAQVSDGNVIRTWHIEHDNALAEMRNMLKELRVRRNFNVKQPVGMYLPTRTKEAIEYILDNPQYFNFGNKDVTPPITVQEEIQGYREKLATLQNTVIECDKKSEEYKKQSLETKRLEIEEITKKIADAKAVVDKGIGHEVEKMINRLSSFYDYNSSYQDFVSAWKFYKFDTFSKGKIMFNFIQTYLSDNSDIVKSAIYNMVRQYLLDSKEVLEALKQSGKTEAEAIENIFRLLVYMFRLDKVLVLESQDKLELESAINAEKPQTMSDEDKAVLDMFLANLSGQSDAYIAKAFRDFERKDLLDDELYLSVAYNNEAELEALYPAWYNRDFNLAENIKIMLLCGVPMDKIDKNHKGDKKLMGIVKDTDIDPQYIIKLMDYLQE